MVMLSELNYLQEARNTEMLRQNLADFPQIYIPAVVHDFTSPRVLTTELVRGQKVSKLTPLALIEGDYAELAAVLTQRLPQADLRRRHLAQRSASRQRLHPREPRRRTARRRSCCSTSAWSAASAHEFQDEIIKLLLAISSNRGAEVADACVRMSRGAGALRSA